jgi:hypothetical protein
MMKRQLTILTSVLLAGLGPSAFAVETGFEKYQVILDRNPFGEAPDLSDQAAAPAPTISLAESFARSLKMTAILEPDNQPRKVGLVDTATNDSYFLAEGEIDPNSGVELVSADFEQETALLRKGDEMVELRLTSGEFTPLTPSEQKERLSEREKLQLSYAERRKARLERRKEAAAQPPPEPQFKGEELKKHLEEYQMEVIRQGLPPLPIPLTPEMDDQLVAEGVLPPAE